jgi:hypothetical protein
MRFDTYTLKGRIVPAFFSIIIPIMIFNHFYASEEFSKFVGEVMGAKLASNLTISTICLIFLSQFGRVLGKNVFEKIFFREEKFMPTTNFLLFSDDTYSEQHKLKIREKIAIDFKSTLPTKEEEAKNINQSRMIIVELMALVRSKLKGNEFLLQHNIEYGAMRNVIGGSILGCLLSIGNIIFFEYIMVNDLAVNISIATLIIYGLLIVLSKVLIEFYGKSYAKILFREYLSVN